MAKFKEHKFDILRVFGEESTFYYHDPSTTWRIIANFDETLKRIEGREDKHLNATDLEAQRSLLRVKVQFNWLVLEMIQPTFKVYKELTVLPKEEEQSIDDNSFDSDFENIKRENLDLPVRTKIINKLVSEGIEGWEFKVLDMLKYDYSNYKFN